MLYSIPRKADELAVFNAGNDSDVNALQLLNHESIPDASLKDDKFTLARAVHPANMFCVVLLTALNPDKSALVKCVQPLNISIVAYVYPIERNLGMLIDSKPVHPENILPQDGPVKVSKDDRSAETNPVQP